MMSIDIEGAVHFCRNAKRAGFFMVKLLLTKGA